MNRYVLYLFVVSIATVMGGSMKLYKKTDDNTYRRVLIPVSSTVIPLDDLPEFQVGIGINVKNPPTQILKPDGDIKLLTAKKLDKQTLKKKTFKKNSGVVVEEIKQ